MNLIISLLIIVVAYLFSFQATAQECIVNIVPKPVNIVLKEGVFVIDRNTSIRVNNSKKLLKPVVAFLSEGIKSVSGISLPTSNKKKNLIIISLDDIKNLGDEGYQLIVTPSKIKLRRILQAEFYPLYNLCCKLCRR